MLDVTNIGGEYIFRPQVSQQVSRSAGFVSGSPAAWLRSSLRTGTTPFFATPLTSYWMPRTTPLYVGFFGTVNGLGGLIRAVPGSNPSSAPPQSFSVGLGGGHNVDGVANRTRTYVYTAPKGGGESGTLPGVWLMELPKALKGTLVVVLHVFHE
jgi:hypothetical protein